MESVTHKILLKVFLCHSNEDKPAVRVLYQDLRKDGFDPWLDEEKLVPGQDWDLEIKKAERGADVIIVCASKASVKKEGYINKEIKFALDIADEKLDDTIYIIPAKLESCNLPDKLKRWQWVDLFAPNGYTKLKTALHTKKESIITIVPKEENNDVYPEQPIKELDSKSSNNIYNNSKIYNEPVSFRVKFFGSILSSFLLISLLFFNAYFISNTLYLLGLESLPEIFSQVDFGIAVLFSVLLSQVVALFIIFETYGVSKLTGVRYMTNIIKTFRGIAWTIVCLGFISWIALGLLGLEARGLFTFSLNQNIKMFSDFSIYSITNVMVFLATALLMNEAISFPVSVLELFSIKMNPTSESK